MLLSQAWATFILVLHTAAAVVLIGSATHNGILAFMHLTGKFTRAKLRRTYAGILSISFGATFLLGTLIYPAFRVRVRAAWLDAHVPLATGFFEVKEHWVAIAIGILIWYLPMGRRVDIKERTAAVRLYHLCGIVIALTVWWAFFTGLTLVTMRSV